MDNGMMRFKQFLAEKKSGLGSDHHELAMAEAIRRHANLDKIQSQTSNKVKELKSHPEFEGLVQKYSNHVKHVLIGTNISSPITAIHWHDRPEHIKQTFGENIPDHTRPADLTLVSEDGKHTHIDFKKSPKYSYRTAGENELTNLGIEVNRQHMPTNAKAFYEKMGKMKDEDKTNYMRTLINGQPQGDTKHFTYKVVIPRSQESPIVIRNDHFADSILNDKTHSPELYHKEGSNSVSYRGLSLNFKQRSKSEPNSRLNIAVRKRRYPSSFKRTQ